MTVMCKKLIEVVLPLEAINIASARKKSIRHGHPSTLHLWLAHASPARSTSPWAPGGVPDTVVSIVSENCRTLKFADFGFERE